MGPELEKLVAAPIGQAALERATHAAAGENPVCGDRLRIEARIEDARFVELAFRATACPACIAVASCAVNSLAGAAFPVALPCGTLRAEVQRLGGLSPFEQHALALVEDVLQRLRTTMAT